MTPEKDAALCAKYPKIFRDRNAPPTQTCMTWGFECSDGWYDVIDVLCAQIQAHVDSQIRSQQYKIESGKLSQEDAIPEDELQVVAVQVKEKFGGLRFYVNNADDRVYGMIDMASAMSYRICEQCGKPGAPGGTGWIETLCNECRSTKK